MLEAASRLTVLLQTIPHQFSGFTEEELAFRSASHKWSKKEILGHLCDSAINNLSRFVRAQTDIQPFPVTSYAQNEWVAIQAYHDAPSEDILELWVSLNKSIVRVISALSEEKGQRPCILSNGDQVMLHWLINDYVDHMEHHLKQIFPDRI
ncbi:DinB family protein [Brevibacillus migulae]|uniref:DinB family protein n=1 Tax=Brevibacillus migulae TaxID=1644114 RepID=UPI00106EB588|nr:DinB family protein [Brevibacillus migulae]